MAEAERYKHFLMSRASYCGTMIKGARHRDRVSGVDTSHVPLWLAADQVPVAERLGLVLQELPFKEPEFLGVPSRGPDAEDPSKSWIRSRQRSIARCTCLAQERA